LLAYANVSNILEPIAMDILIDHLKL